MQTAFYSPLSSDAKNLLLIAYQSCIGPPPMLNFYRTQVYLGSDLWVPSVCNSLRDVVETQLM